MPRQEKQLYEFGPFRLDTEERALLRDGEPVPLTPKAYETLLLLVERSGRILTKEEMMRAVWPETFVEEANLAHNISVLRKALGESPSEQHYIQTVPRRGYRFVASVRRLDEAQEPISENQDPLHSVTEGAEQASHSSGEVTAAPPAPGAHQLAHESDAHKPSGARGKRWLILALAGLSVAVIATAIYKFAGQHESPDITHAPAPKIVPLTSFAGAETAPALSPEGERVAYARRTEGSDNFDIYVQQIGTGSPFRLTTDPAHETVPEWSPDGQKIAFVRAPLKLNLTSQEKYNVYVIPSLGGAERKVGEFAGGNWMPVCWTADSKSLAVRDSISPGEPLSIYLLSIESGEKRKITSPPAGSSGDSCPAFSPNGSMLAFVRGKGGSEMDVHVQPMTPSGEPRRLTFDNTQLWDLTWTGDGREIVFGSNRGGSRGGLWRVPVEGGEPQPVPGTGMYSVLPHISRKGDRLAFDQQIYDTNVWRYEVPSPKGHAIAPTKIIASSLQDEAGHYSPDGRKIAFVSNRSGRMEVWVCEADGSGPRQLTSLAGNDTGTPRWSPDSRQVIFESRLDGHADLFVVGEEDARVRRLTTETSNDGAPCWSRDGRTIYFGSNRGGSYQIWKMPAEGGEARQVTKGGGRIPLESPDGKHLYYTKGSIWRVPVEGGEEVPVIEDPRPFSYGYWAVAEGGIYFATGGVSLQPVIHFFDFATGRVTEVVKLKVWRLPGDPVGLSVSADGRWLLATQLDATSTDIMMVENFR